VDGDAGERDLVAERHRDGCAQAGLDQFSHRLRIAQRANRDAGQALRQRFLQCGGGVAGAAGHAVVAVVEQQHRAGCAFGELAGMGDRLGKRLAVVDELLAFGPDLRCHTVSRRLRGLRLAGRHHAHARRRDVGQRKAGEHADC